MPGGLSEEQLNAHMASLLDRLPTVMSADIRAEQEEYLAEFRCDGGSGDVSTSPPTSAPASAPVSACPSASGHATASAPTPAIHSVPDTAPESAPASTPATVSDSEEETITPRWEHCNGRSRKSQGSAHRQKKPKTKVDAELNRAREIWMMGRITKWEYHHFCNQVHACQQSLKVGSIQPEGFQRSVQIMMEQLVHDTHWRKACSKQKQSPNNKGREPYSPLGKCQPEPKPRMHGIYRRGKRGGHTEMAIYGGVKVRKHYNRWQRSRRRRWDSILNVKRSAESVAEGAAQVTLTTQRMMPAPRRKKKRRRISRLPIAGA